MYKGIFIALLIVGILLTIFGISEMESFGSDVSRFFTGTPTDRSMWLLIGGIVCGVVGLFGLLSKK
jgi:H+/Cl- antiporter ClcA